MKAYQLRIAVKRHKPAIWRRCVVPGGITYAQLSLILTEVMGIEGVEEYHFEFYDRKFRFYEDWEGKPGMRKYNYSVGEASDFYIDEFLDLDDWFSFHCGGKWKLRVTVERRLTEKTGKSGSPCGERLSGESGLAGETGENGLIEESEEIQETGVACGGKESGHGPWVMEIRELSPEGTAVDGADRISGINEQLKEKYTVRYQGPEIPGKRRQEILREQEAGQYGLTGWEDPKNDPQKIKYCTESHLQRVAEVYREKYGDVMNRNLEKILSGETEVLFGLPLAGTPEQQEAYFRDPANRLSLPELLLWNSQEALMKLGKELGLPGNALLDNSRNSSPDKKQLAEQAAGRLLERDMLEQCLMVLDDGTLQAWERAVLVGRRHKPSLDDLDALGRLYEHHYLAIYDDDEVEVPPEVVVLYQEINTPEFQERRRQAWWLLSCLEMHAVIYGVSPWSVVMELYQKKPGYCLEPEAFVRVFRDIPDHSNPCVLLGDRVVARAALEGDAYLELEKMQHSWEFFLPEADEIEDCSRHGYPSQSPYYQKLKQFLCENLGLKIYGAERALLELWGMIAWGYDTPRLTRWMKERTPGRLEETVWEEYGHVIENVRIHTRKVQYRGWMAGKM